VSEPVPVLEHWVIYDHPLDFPKHFVVRLWLIQAGRIEVTNGVWLRDDLAGARAVIKANCPGGYRLDRWDGDDPAIVEVWI
jgi:hypothetical protein